MEGEVRRALTAACARAHPPMRSRKEWRVAAPPAWSHRLPCRHGARRQEPAQKELWPSWPALAALQG